MDLVAPTQAHLAELMTWFQDEQQLFEWAGPNFRFPYSPETFREDLGLTRLDSFCLENESSDLLAFGQCYQRVERCHLGRLAVAPNQRGQGIVALLIDQVSQRGMNKLNLEECSLFVLEHNHAAIKAYIKYGFEITDYPSKSPLKNCLYMVK